MSTQYYNQMHLGSTVSSDTLAPQMGRSLSSATPALGQTYSSASYGGPMATRSNMSFQRSTSRMSEAAPTLLGLAPTMSTATPELEAIHDDHQRALEMCAQEQEHRMVLERRLTRLADAFAKEQHARQAAEMNFVQRFDDLSHQEAEKEQSGDEAMREEIGALRENQEHLERQVAEQQKCTSLLLGLMEGVLSEQEIVERLDARDRNMHKNFVEITRTLDATKVEIDSMQEKVADGFGGMEGLKHAMLAHEKRVASKVEDVCEWKVGGLSEGFNKRVGASVAKIEIAHSNVTAQMDKLEAKFEYAVKSIHADVAVEIEAVRTPRPTAPQERMAGELTRLNTMIANLDAKLERTQVATSQALVRTLDERTRALAFPTTQAATPRPASPLQAASPQESAAAPAPIAQQLSAEYSEAGDVAHLKSRVQALADEVARCVAQNRVDKEVLSVAVKQVQLQTNKSIGCIENTLEAVSHDVKAAKSLSMVMSTDNAAFTHSLKARLVLLEGGATPAVGAGGVGDASMRVFAQDQGALKAAVASLQADATLTKGRVGDVEGVVADLHAHSLSTEAARASVYLAQLHNMETQLNARIDAFSH